MAFVYKLDITVLIKQSSSKILQASLKTNFQWHYHNATHKLSKFIILKTF